MTTGDICAKLPWLNRCTVMQHLGVLENARLVLARKEGRQRLNYLDVGPIQRTHERWIQSYAAPSADLLSKWQQELENLRFIREFVSWESKYPASVLRIFGMASRYGRSAP